MTITKKFTSDDDRVSIVDAATNTQIEVVRTPEGYVVDIYQCGDHEPQFIKSMQVWDDECGNDEYEWKD